MKTKTTPPEILDRAAAVSSNLLPQISRKKYETAYEKFMREKILNIYALAQYSMLRIINIKHNVDISTYPKLLNIPKKSKILTEEEMQQFLNEASDEMYLLIKVAVAIGLTGACRREELWNLKTDDLKDLNSALLVKIQKLRNLEHLRRSATILVNAGGDLLTLKRHGGWCSSSVAENYIDDCITNKITLANKIVTSIERPTVTNLFTQMDTENPHYLHEDQPSTSTNINITKNLLKNTDIPGLSLNNCSNFTINYNFK
ncbi:hypothetical protein NQ318_010076 [Aromia moschata]|uniref:Tyr recombinase domain-containing protein n=1 Tax=Aromia moschata TaxID=1265417 RepID=A0AAV8YF60_9CUCU|nr:hypothetical protein NQ318_010076 [Aromia moschata]